MFVLSPENSVAEDIRWPREGARFCQFRKSLRRSMILQRIFRNGLSCFQTFVQYRSIPTSVPLSTIRTEECSDFRPYCLCAFLKSLLSDRKAARHPKKSNGSLFRIILRFRPTGSWKFPTNMSAVYFRIFAKYLVPLR